MRKRKVFAVIMAGGLGTRLWPLSRSIKPKQFMKVLGNKTSLQETFSLLVPRLSPEEIVIVATEKHMKHMKAQLPEVPRKNFLVEPAGRNTAACIGLAATLIERETPGAIMAVLASDQIIRPKQKFIRALNTAIKVADEKKVLVTYGLKPTEPSTQYGYIQKGKETPSSRNCKIFKVKAFKEKPDLKTAQRFYKNKSFYWNSGMFVWRTGVILSALEKFMPQHFKVISEFKDRKNLKNEKWKRDYTRLPAISIDYGVLEKAKNVWAVEAGFACPEVGNWRIFETLCPKGHNSIIGKHIGLDTHSCIIVGHHGHLVSTIGIKDLIIVHTPDATLVCDKNKSSSVRQLVKELELQGHREHL